MFVEIPHIFARYLSISKDKNIFYALEIDISNRDKKKKNLHLDEYLHNCKSD